MGEGKRAELVSTDLKSQPLTMYSIGTKYRHTSIELSLFHPNSLSNCQKLIVALLDMLLWRNSAVGMPLIQRVWEKQSNQHLSVMKPRILAKPDESVLNDT